ncbi:phage tail protein [Agromyces soli]
MRGAIPGLASPHPFVTRLPAVLQEDDFLQRMLPAFDDAIAPVLSVLDNLAAYVDPQLAPADHLDWLASWVDLQLDEAWTEGQRRRLVAGAVSLHHRSGTVGGISDAVALAAGPGAEVSVREPGGVAWSAEPGGELPGGGEPIVIVEVAVAERSDELEARLRRAVRALVPAHLPCELRLREAQGGAR